MNKMMYGVRKETIEIDRKHAHLIKVGCTLDSDNQGEAFVRFDSEEEAMRELEKYESRINDYGRFFYVEEYFVDEVEVEYDEDFCEWEDTFDHYEILKFQNLKINVEDENGRILKTFSDYSDAANYKNRLSFENDLCCSISFN